MWSRKWRPQHSGKEEKISRIDPTFFTKADKMRYASHLLDLKDNKNFQLFKSDILDKRLGSIRLENCWIDSGIYNIMEFILKSMLWLTLLSGYWALNYSICSSVMP